MRCYRFAGGSRFPKAANREAMIAHSYGRQPIDLGPQQRCESRERRHFPPLRGQSLCTNHAKRYFFMSKTRPTGSLTNDLRSFVSSVPSCPPVLPTLIPPDTMIGDLSENAANGDLPPQRIDEFLRLLAKEHRRLFMYIMSLMQDRNAAEDVLQEAHLVMWREFNSFVPGTNFAAWAFRIAYHQMLAWRKRQQRDRLQFSDEFLRLIADEIESSADHLERRLEALTECIERLPEHHRELIRYRYTSGDAIEAIAQRVDRSSDAVYRMLSRIRQLLHDCISKTLSVES